jgi:hypothetical protein
VHDVRVERLPPRLGVGLLELRPARRATRVGDQQVEPAERVARLGREALEPGSVGDVTAPAWTVTPRSRSASAVRSASAPSRAQIPSAQPSPASRSAIARPMPRVPR